jgi:hypothetical protein
MLNPLIFLNPLLTRPNHLLEQERLDYLETTVIPNAVPWTSKTRWAPELYIKADTWQPKLLFDVTPGAVLPSNRGVVYNGPFADPTYDLGYRASILKAGCSLWTAQGNRKGRVYFDADVIVPSLWEGGPTNVWMSITPMELMTQRPGLRFATKTVVVGGLGMGWFMDQVCAKKSVTKVIVVEKSKALVDWFGQDLCDAQPKVELIVDDVFNQIGKHGENAVLLDIWKSYGTARDDFRVLPLRKKHPDIRFWCWGAGG